MVLLQREDAGEWGVMPPQGSCSALQSCPCFALAQLQPVPPWQTRWWARPEDGSFWESS